MREELKKKLGSRLRFKGTFRRYGLKAAYKGLPLETVCLQDITAMHIGDVTDHLWFNRTKGFKALGLLYPGDVIAFDARVESYLKGYAREDEPREVDYHLTRPTKLAVVARGSPRNIYNVCGKCDHPNNLSSERCRRCGSPFEEQPEPKPDPEMRQRTLDAEFTSIMKSIGAIKK